MKIYFLTILMTIAVMMSCKTSLKNQMTENNLIPFDSLLSNYYQDYIQKFPLTATALGDYRYNDLLPNTLTHAYKEDMKNFYTKYLNLLDKYDYDALSKNNQENYDILKYDCSMALEGLQFHDELMPINQMWTLDLYIAQLAGGKSIQPFRNTLDYENWLKRLDAFADWCDTAIVNMKEGIATGYVLPKSLIVKVIPQLASFTKGPAEQHLFYQPVKSFPDSLSPEDKTRLKKEYVDMINRRIIPTFDSLYYFFTNVYLPAGRETSGIGALPDGEKYYAYLVKYFTTTNLSANEIYNIGTDEVTRITGEMEAVKKQVGFKGDLKSFFNFIRKDKELMPYTKPEQILEHFSRIYQTIKPNLPKLFNIIPKTPFEIKRTEKFRENSASAEYNQGTLDGSRPGVFYVPIPDASKYNIFADEDLFLHEVIPGHHFQISLQQENKELPDFRKALWYSAYGEGWALYSESLGKDLGLFTNPYQYFGMLSYEMHRAIRLVVDVGIHVKGWSREQAIQYSLEHEASPESEIIAEVERYMAGPGQALSYKIGELKIEELRARAETTLGDKFDIRKFHDTILETGCIPLNILEKKVDTWIKESQQEH